MIYKKIKDSNYIWNPDTTLVFKSMRELKAIGRYVDKKIISDSKTILIAKKFNIQLDDSLLNCETKINDESSSIVDSISLHDSIISDSSTDSHNEYENHPAFLDNIIDRNISISTDFVETYIDELKEKLSGKINDLVYRVIDLESTIKNLSNDYEQLLIENQTLKKQLLKK